MKKSYALHIEYNTHKNGYVESRTVFHLSAQEVAELMDSEKQREKVEKEYDYVKFELFELTPEFDENLDELWTAHSEFSKAVDLKEI